MLHGTNVRKKWNLALTQPCNCSYPCRGVLGAGGGFKPPEIPKALQNRGKLYPVMKTVKIAEFRTPTPQDVRKKAVKS